MAEPSDHWQNQKKPGKPCGICNHAETELYEDCCISLSWCPNCGALSNDYEDGPDEWSEGTLIWRSPAQRESNVKEFK